MPAPSFTPFSGEVTSYGYRSDSTPDQNSEDGIGCENNKLVPYVSLAVSHDVEAAFHAAGIQLLDPVQILTANGDVLSLVWGDRTGTEVDGKPEVGRFDVYSPRGLCAHNGMPVTGFRGGSANE